MTSVLPDNSATTRVLVLASSATLAAARSLAVLRPGETAVVLPHDLSRSGWTYSDREGAISFATAAGRFSTAPLEHVVVLLEAIAPTQLPHVSPSDRSYVASELTAFLRAWLAGLRCRVWNVPDALSLAGPEPLLHSGDDRWGSMSAALAEAS